MTRRYFSSSGIKPHRRMRPSSWIASFTGCKMTLSIHSNSIIARSGRFRIERKYGVNFTARLLPRLTLHIRRIRFEKEVSGLLACPLNPQIMECSGGLLNGIPPPKDGRYLYNEEIPDTFSSFNPRPSNSKFKIWLNRNNL